MTKQKIIQANSKLEYIGDDYLGSAIFLIEEKSTHDFDFQLVKVQWTKTQKIYAVRVPNYFTGRHNTLQLGYDNLKQTKEFFNEILEKGSARHWTNQVVYSKIQQKK